MIVSCVIWPACMTASLYFFASLYDVTLEKGVPQATRFGKAKNIEECSCPPEYIGTSCQVNKLQAFGSVYLSLFVVSKFSIVIVDKSISVTT